MKTRISVCMITRNDPHLAKCLESIIKYVDEVCLVITSKSDIESEKIAQQYNVNYKFFEECNLDDKIMDFSLARNESLKMAKNDWVMWLDSDDLVKGAENLETLINSITPVEGTGFLFPYEYSYTPDGLVSCLHYRERLVFRGQDFHFINPVHEVLIAKDGINPHFIKIEDIIIKHQRQFNNKPQDPYRNLRILQNYIEKVPDDPRQMYYIGLEYANVGDINNSIKYLAQYIEKSGWDDERVMACLKLVDLLIAQSQFKEALNWSMKAIALKPNWFEGYYSAMKVFYFTNDWQNCINFAELGLIQPPTETLLFVNQADRFDIHIFLNVAYNAVGNIEKALYSTGQGLLGNPQHAQLLNNAAIYRDFLNPEEEKETDENCLNIVFATGPSPEPWSPESVKTSGIGGSEMMLIHQAKNLAALGHRVRVYAACQGKFDGVEYHPWQNFRNVKCDVLVVSRYTPLLDPNLSTAKLKLLWCHDISPISATAELLLEADRILALSEWHRQTIISNFNLHPEQVIVTRNGIDLNRFENKIVRQKYKCVNSSSPDRSWPILLDIWPKIVAQVPAAELHLFYGFTNWKIMAAHDPLQMDLIKRLEKQIQETKNVIFHDRVSQEELAKEFLSSSCWLHPTWFSETSCITAMEVQAAGLHMVTSAIAALNETARDGVLINGDWTTPEYQKQFIEATVLSLKNNEIPEYDVEKFDIISLADEWQDLFAHLLNHKKTHPILPYQPTRTYLPVLNTPVKEEIVKLNIAAGPNVFSFPGWINYDRENFSEYFQFLQNKNTRIDLMPEYQKPLAKYLQNGGELDFRVQDMVQPFSQHSDNSVNYIVVGQAIEHLNYVTQAPAFLKECYRMLKPGGILRMSTPDINRLMNAYNNNEMMKFAQDQPDFYKDLDPTAQLAMIMYGASGSNCTQQNYEGHFFCYSEKSMTDLLTRIGFKEIEFYNWNGQSKSPILKQEVQDHGLSHSFIVEAIK